MSASSPLSIKLVPALPSDAAAIADLAIAAFSEDHLQRLPLPPSVPRRDPASWRKKLVESLAKAASDEGKKEGHELVKAVGALEGKDGRQEDILGFGLWMWVDKARPAEGLVEDDFRSELMSTDPWLDAMFGRARSGSEGGDAGSDAAGLVEETTTPWEAMAAQTNKVYQQWGIPHKRIYCACLLFRSRSSRGSSACILLSRALSWPRPHPFSRPPNATLQILPCSASARRPKAVASAAPSSRADTDAPTRLAAPPSSWPRPLDTLCIRRLAGTL